MLKTSNETLNSSKLKSEDSKSAPTGEITRTVKSKYKIWGGLTLLIFLNVLFLPFSWMAIYLTCKNLFTSNYEWQGIDIGIPFLIILLQLIFLVLLTTECKYMKVETDKITFINPIFPFLRKTIFFNEYDCKQIVEEYSSGGCYEALWLIKNRKLKVRISSFYYSNYSEIKNSIRIKDKGMLIINPFKQLGCLFGMKI